MSERMITANGIDLCTESFGNPSDPAILLIAGAMESMIWWEDDFCRQLANGGRFVIRYDHRDTGRSVTYTPGAPPYHLDDMVEDAIGVLDAYEVNRAHLVGMSLGGIIAQLITIRHANRVRTITLIASTPHGPEDPDLPPMEAKMLEFFGATPPPDWSEKTAAIDYMVSGRRLLNGSAHPYDEATARALAARELARATNVASSANHALIPSERWRERLGDIRVPTLVIHGTEDPVLPYGHGLALAREIPGATLLTLEGTGHEIHHADWDLLIRSLLRHTEV